MRAALASRERVNLAIRGERTDRPPVINPVSNATSESCAALGFSFDTVHLDSARMAALAAWGHEALGFDSVMPYFSVVQEAAAFGAEIDWGSSNTMPRQVRPVYTDPGQFKMPRDFADRPAIRTVVEAIRLLKKKLGNGAYVIGKVMGPWTLSYHLHGMENFLMETIDEPEKVDAFLAGFRRITEAFAELQLEAGADAVTIADHITRDLIGPAAYRRFLLDVHRGILKKFEGETFILHCCGNTMDRIALFAEAGFPVFHFDSKNDVAGALEAAGDMKLTGCVNNPVTLLFGSREAVRSEVDGILDKGVRILSPECALPLDVKNENLVEIVNTAKDSRSGSAPAHGNSTNRNMTGNVQ